VSAHLGNKYGRFGALGCALDHIVRRPLVTVLADSHSNRASAAIQRLSEGATQADLARTYRQSQAIISEAAAKPIRKGTPKK
jgi:hypothetical protein